MPICTVIAGPNGAGKTKYTDILIKTRLNTTLPVNLDLLDGKEEYIFGNVYNWEENLKKAKHYAFIDEINKAIKQNKDFSFECNLRQDQINHLYNFDKNNYTINLVYIFINDVCISKERVNYRVNYENGNFVSNHDIEMNYKESLKMLNKSINDWDNVVIIDNSKQLNIDKITSKTTTLNIVCHINNNKLIYFDKSFPPSKFNKILPNIIAKKEKYFGNDKDQGMNQSL